jgi:hypothetical protein
MKPKGLIVAAVLLAGLSGALWWSNKQKAAEEAAPPKSSSTAPKIVDIKPDSVSKLEIQKKGADATVLEKTAQGWQITAPKPYRADQDAVTSLLSALSPLNSDAVVEEKAADISKYGLTSPSITLAVTTKDGKVTKLLAGDDEPTGGGAYFSRAGDPRVFSIATFAKGNFDKSLNDLRDKRLLTFDSDKLARVNLIAKGQSLEFGKNNQNEWQILSPKPMRADSLQVEELVRKLKDAKMDLTVSDEDAKKAVSAYASGTPAGTAKVTDSNGTQTLEVRKDKAGTYYAKSSAAEGVFKVASDLGTGLDKGLADFRNKKLFDFSFSEPGRVEIHDGAKTYQFQRAGETWNSAGKKMDNVSVQSLIDKLRDLSATGFPESGAGVPTLEITVVSNEGKRTEKVSIAAVGAKFIAKRDNETALYELDPKSVRDIQQAASDVKPAAPEKKK